MPIKNVPHQTHACEQHGDVPHACAKGMNYPGPGGGEVRSEPGEPYLGDQVNELCARGSIVPAPAGSSQPGDKNEESE